MKKLLLPAGILLFVTGLSAFTFKAKKSFNTSKADSILADRKHYMDEWRAAIKGKGRMAADSVFKNIQMFKGVPAGRMLAIMDMGYSNSLGVSCGYCHDTQHFELETKPAKGIARKMSAMNGVINNQLLKNIQGLQGPNPVVNCTTCHRGATEPALDMPAPPGGN
jgi:hypothetical protein